LNDIPALSNRTSRDTRCGWSIATVDAIHPPIDTPARSTAGKWVGVEERFDKLRFLGNRIGAVGGLRGLAAAQRIRGVHVIAGTHQVRCEFEPIVLRLRAESVNEHDRLSGAAFDVVDAIAVDDHRSAVNSGASQLKLAEFFSDP